MLDRNFSILEVESVLSLVDGMLDCLYLLGNDREHLKLNSIELIEATPGTAAGESFEELTHCLVVETV